MIEDAEELGRRIGAVRGWADMSKDAFAKRLGTTKPTLLKWEAGDFGNRRSLEARRQLAELVARELNAPPELLGLTEMSPQLDDVPARLAAVERSIARLAALALDADEEAEVQRYMTTAPSSEEQGHGGASE